MLQNIDNSVLLYLNQTIRNPVFDAVMPFISQYGYYSWIGCVVLVAFLDKRSGFRNAYVILTSLLAGWVTTEQILKPLLHRPRPYLNTLDLPVHILVPLQSNASFPSGAAVLSFAALIPFVIYYRKSKMVFLVLGWSFLIMLSRVYVGAHYPSDVIAGLIFGSLVGLAFVWFDLLAQNQELRDRKHALKKDEL